MDPARAFRGRARRGDAVSPRGPRRSPDPIRGAESGRGAPRAGAFRQHRGREGRVPAGARPATGRRAGPGPPFRSARPAPESRFRPEQSVHRSVRRGRADRHLQCRQRRLHAAAALPGGRSSRRGHAVPAGRSGIRDRPRSRHERVPGRLRHLVQQPGRHPRQPRVDAGVAGRYGERSQPAGLRGVLPCPRCSARGRSRLRRTRRAGRVDRHVEPRRVVAAFRRIAGCHRRIRATGRPAVHHRRRHAAIVPVVPPGRRLDAVSVSNRPAGRRDQLPARGPVASGPSRASRGGGARSPCPPPRATASRRAGRGEPPRHPFLPGGARPEHVGPPRAAGGGGGRVPAHRMPEHGRPAGGARRGAGTRSSPSEPPWAEPPAGSPASS